MNIKNDLTQKVDGGFKNAQKVWNTTGILTFIPVNALYRILLPRARRLHEIILHSQFLEVNVYKEWVH